MFEWAAIKDPGYYLRCVAARATPSELGLHREFAPNRIVAYALADGSQVARAVVRPVRQQGPVAGLRWADGSGVALDQVTAVRTDGRITGYQRAGGAPVDAATVQHVTVTARRTVGYRIGSGPVLTRDQLRPVTAAEAGMGLAGPDGRAIDPATVAIRDRATGRILGYYTASGETPGQWIGRGAAALGLTGLVSLTENRDVYEALMAGRDPVTGTPLTRGQPGGTRVMGLDGLFTTGKSVSLLWGFATDDRVRAAIEAAHDESVRAALTWLESHASTTRRGHASSGPGDPYPETIHDVPTTGLFAVKFDHRTTRPTAQCPCGEPHLHSHVTVMNLARGADGHWTTLDSKRLHALAKPTAFLEQAEFRARLSSTLDALGYHIEWTPPVNGHAEIQGLDRRDWVEAFSQRTAEAEAALDAKGLADVVGAGPSAARDQAGHETRAAKETGHETPELLASWAGPGAAVGLGPKQAEVALHQQPRSTAEATLTPTMATTLAGQLTAQANVFGLAEAIEAVANAARRGLAIDRAVELARELVQGASGEIVALGEHARRAIRLATGRRVTFALSGELGTAYTMREVLRLERGIVRDAQQRRTAGVGLARPEAVIAALAAYDAVHPDATLGEDQVAAVVGLTTDGAGLSILSAPAGYGKTTALTPAVAAWQASGVPVYATAVMGARAAALGTGIGLTDPTRIRTLADLCASWQRPRDAGQERLPHGGVVLLDEAEVVPLQDPDHHADWDTLRRAVAAVGGKLVAVGDDCQLGPIGPRAPSAELMAVAPTYELRENRRQVVAWERAALAQLRAGQVAEAVAAYDREGHIVYAAGETRQAKAALLAQAAQDYLAARDRGESVALMVATHRDRTILNTHIRAALVARGVERGGVAAKSMRVGELEVAVGDQLQALHNDRRLGLRNSTLVQVEAIDPMRRTATVRRPDGEAVVLPRPYLATWIAHGYAQTVHRAQGETVDTPLLVADRASLDSQFGYTALTRGRQPATLYFAGPRPIDLEHHLPAADAPKPEAQREQIIAGLSRDRNKELASELIAQLDRGDRAGAEATLRVTVDATQAVATWQAAVLATDAAIERAGAARATAQAAGGASAAWQRAQAAEATKVAAAQAQQRVEARVPPEERAEAWPALEAARDAARQERERQAATARHQTEADADGPDLAWVENAMERQARDRAHQQSRGPVLKRRRGD